MATVFISLIATFLITTLSLAEEMGEIKKELVSARLINNLIEMDV